MNMMDFGGGLFPFALSSESFDSQLPHVRSPTRSRCGRHSRVRFADGGSFAMVCILFPFEFLVFCFGIAVPVMPILP
jgi:hypothetical protein